MNTTMKIILKIVCYLLLLAIIGASIYGIVKVIPTIPGYEDFIKKNPNADKAPTEINKSEDLLITDTLDFYGFNQRYGYVNGKQYYSEQFVKEVYNSSNCENPSNETKIKCGNYFVELRMNTNNVPRDIYIGNVLPNRDFKNYVLKVKYDSIAEVKDVTLDEKGTFHSEDNFNICSIRYNGKAVPIAPFMVNSDPGVLKAVLGCYIDMKGNTYTSFFDYSLGDLYKKCYEITPVADDPYKNTGSTFFEDTKREVKPLMYSSIVGDISGYTMVDIEYAYPLNSFVIDINEGKNCLYLGNLFNGYEFEKCSVVVVNEDNTKAQRIYLNKQGCINYKSDKKQNILIVFPRYDNVRFSFDRILLFENKDKARRVIKTKYVIDGVDCYGVLTYHEESKFSTEQ